VPPSMRNKRRGALHATASLCSGKRSINQPDRKLFRPD
jgi:hypothetical protein